MSKLHFTIAFLFPVLFTSCVFDKDDHRLRVYNNTDRNLYYLPKNDSLLKLEDVEFINEKQKFYIAHVKDTNYPVFARINEGGYVKKINNRCLDSTMFFYVFEIDSVKKYGWESIVKNKQFYKIVGFKVGDLDSLKWTINLNDFYHFFN